LAAAVNDAAVANGGQSLISASDLVVAAPVTTVSVTVFCDGSTVPFNGGLGTCSSVVTADSQCQITCDQFYAPTGPSNCSADGVFENAACFEEQYTIQGAVTVVGDDLTCSNFTDGNPDGCKSRRVSNRRNPAGPFVPEDQAVDSCGTEPMMPIFLKTLLSGPMATYATQHSLVTSGTGNGVVTVDTCTDTARGPYIAYSVLMAPFITVPDLNLIPSTLTSYLSEQVEEDGFIYQFNMALTEVDYSNTTISIVETNDRICPSIDPYCIAVLPIGSAPTRFVVSGKPETKLPLTIGMIGGYRLNTGANRDMAKIIAEYNTTTGVRQTCSHAPGGGTLIDMDLGPGDAEPVRSATGTFTFLELGRYRVCYMVYSSDHWTEVGVNMGDFGTIVLEKSKVTTLANFTVDRVGLTPAFSSDRYGYTMKVDFRFANMTFFAAPTHPDATMVSGVGTVMAPGVQTDLANNARRFVVLEAGSVTEIKVVVTAANGFSTKETSLYVTRPNSPCNNIGQWSSWGECVGECETGTQTRARIVSPAFCTSSHEGQECTIPGGSCTAEVAATTQLTGVSKEQFEEPKMQARPSSAPFHTPFLYTLPHALPRALPHTLPNTLIRSHALSHADE